MLYSLRTVKPSTPVTMVLLHFDKEQRDCLETLTEGNATSSNWKKANLPIKMGGFGLICSSDQYLAAFISSVNSFLFLVEALIGLKPTLENEVSAHCLVRLQDVDRRIQKKTQENFDQRSLNDLLLKATTVQETARLQSLLAPYACAWLTTLHISALGLHLKAEEIQCCFINRLGIPIYEAPRNCSSSGPFER